MTDRPVRDCQCPRANHQHGTNLAYTRDGCRCDACRDAGMNYQKRYRLGVLRGTANSFIDAAPAREHVRRFMAAYGASQKGVAAGVGVSQTVLRRLLDGQPTMRPDVSARLLALTLDTLPDTATIRARGIVRRVQALATRGISPHEVYLATGVQVQTVMHGWAESGGVGRGSTVTMSGHRRVDAYYQAHAYAPMRVGRTPSEKKAISFALNRATREGWAPPAAWDDIDLDKAPATTPAYKTVSPMGRRREDVIDLLIGGHPPAVVIQRMGLKDFNALRSLLETAGRHDLIAEAEYAHQVWKDTA